MYTSSENMCRVKGFVISDDQLDGESMANGEDEMIFCCNTSFFLANEGVRVCEGKTLKRAFCGAPDGALARFKFIRSPEKEGK
jgi:hypothetical protein